MKHNRDDSLFDFSRREFLATNAPLADRMRPRDLDDFCGQERIVGPGRLLRRAIQADQLSSLIFYGPPGTGKTTLARIIANTTKADFITLNAVLSGVKDIRTSIDRARERLGGSNRRTILFIDEVHRFNKIQQDALLPHVENGTVIFIGATTENPYFEVNKALLSRSRIFQLTTLTSDHLMQAAMKAVQDKERGYGKLDIQFKDNALLHLVEMANGDARALLNALELAVQTTEVDIDNRIIIDRQVAEESIQKKAVLYDKDGDAHYDVISAFIKSMRGSDPDAALYWLAKMIYAGEDPRFIFRRMMILASEDVGMADPHALQVVNAAAQTFDYVGMPEGRFALAQACVYLATAPKSNSLMAFFSALESVGQEQEGEVPDHLKDASRDGEDLGHGKGYLYPHAYRDHWVSQQYLPAALQGRLFYQPSPMGYEKGIKEQVERRREEQLASFLEQQPPKTGAKDKEFFEAHFHGPQQTKNQWLKRTLESTGKRLGQVRDTMYGLAACQADHLVMVLNDPSGLLMWEGLRRATIGGVYSVLDDQESLKLLESQVLNLDVLERPMLVTGGLDGLEKLSVQEKGISFDLILGRGLKGMIDQKPEVIESLGRFLSAKGRMVLAEVLPRFNQRLYGLLPKTALSADLFKALSEAEEAIYTSQNLDWCGEQQLQALFSCSSVELQEVKQEKTASEIYLSPNDVENWFTPRPQDKKKAYCQHLALGLTDQQTIQVRAAFDKHLSGKVVQWESVTAFIVLSAMA